MRTTTSPSTRGTPLVASHMATPPPSTTLDLHHADTVIGWIDDTAIGFRGFGDETEAVHAAWVAYRTMSRRFARESGRRPLPIDTEPMALQRSGDVETILAGGRPIATLVRPGADSRSGPESFGFELQVPIPVNELTMRSTAHLVYLTLRRSGVRWTMWATARGESQAPDEARVDDDAPATVRSMPTPSRRAADAASAAAAPADDARGILGTVSVILAMLVLIILPAITTSTVVHLLGAAAAVVALVATASLARRVVTHVRDSVRGSAQDVHGAHAAQGG